MNNDNKITFIIPVFNLDPARLKNFKYTFNLLEKTGCNVIISEQVNKTCSKLSLTTRPTIHHIKTHIDDDKIHKSKLINIAVEETKTPYAWVNDIDCYLHFNKILNTYNFNDNFIQPFETVKDLTENERDQILNGDKLYIPFHGEDIFNNNVDNNKIIRQVCIYGAMSFIFKIQAFIEIGKMDEVYTGWGIEDTDLCIRAENHSGIHIIRGSLGVHLWHNRNNIRENIDNNNHFHSKGMSHDIWRQIFKKYYPDWVVG